MSLVGTGTGEAWAANPVSVSEQLAKIKNATPPGVVTELILDSSGSMKQKHANRSKLLQAKRVMKAFMTQAQADQMELGLRVYGQKERDCKDSQLVYKFGEKDQDAVESAMDSIDPKGYGKTPLDFSLREAAKDLRSHTGKPRRIILVSDGIESCGGDPCKAAAELKRDFDIRIYVVGYGLNTEEREKLQCVADNSDGTMLNAESIQDLLEIFRSMLNQNRNLFVKSPEPMGTSRVYEWLSDGKKKLVGRFVSALGTRVEPGKKHEVQVALSPTYTFNDVVVQPKEIKTLVVQGEGTVNIQFGNSLFSVQLLNELGKPVMTFPSDVPTRVPTGFYHVKAISPPFAEANIDDIQVVPGGLYEEKIKGFGTIQLDSNPKLHGRGPFGYYVFDDVKKEDLGSFLTDAPLVLPLGRYLMKSVGNAVLKNVYPDDGEFKKIPVPPPGQIVTFALREKVDPTSNKDPRFLHEMNAEQVKKGLSRPEEALEKKAD